MYSLLRPLLFAIPPAEAHAAAMAGLAPIEHLGPLRAVARAAMSVRRPELEVRALGLVFPNPVGLAGGFDKNAHRARALAALGFGHLELGTVTARAQEPNPPPNLFRLPKDRALVNRLGFPNDGAEAVAARIARVRSDGGGLGVPIGVSIGKSRVVPLEPVDGVVEDYVASFRLVRPCADFVVVNVSSPNTKGLRAMQGKELARVLFEALGRENAAPRVPLLVKIAPDLDDGELDALLAVASDAGLDGVVATNTTIARDGFVRLESPRELVESIGAGGLSGAPLRARSLEVVRRVRGALGRGPAVIGVGGVDDAASALAMLRAGADLVQVYTGFVYGGPGTAKRIARGLLAEIRRTGASGIGELAGAAAAG